mgnify:CR=1 FL=1
MGNEPIWKVERQPAWLVAAIKKTITDLPGGYAEAAEWLGVTENALFNRLRVDGDQIFPMGWAMVLQKAAGVSYIADAFSRQTDNGIHIPGAAPDTENEEIGLKLAELVGRLGDLVNAYSSELIKHKHLSGLCKCTAFSISRCEMFVRHGLSAKGSPGDTRHHASIIA